MKPTPVSFARVLLTALAGPAAWFIDLSTRFFLVEFGVARASEGRVLALGVGFCVIALVAGLASYRLRSRVHDQKGEAEFVASLGVALGVFSALVIASALVPHLYFDGVVTP
jgi:hypothetical protein